MYPKSMNSSRGVGILISKKIKHEVRVVISDPDDNFLLLDTIINDKRLTLGAVYGPNEDDMAFYDRLRQGILTVKNESVIIGGDWKFGMLLGSIQIWT